MSIKWMATVWEDAKDVEGTELLVLLSIADHADDKGVAWPSVARLGARSRRAESTVQQALTNLEKRGWLQREFRTGSTTMYRLRVPRSQQTTHSETPPVDKGGPDSGGVQPTGPQGSSPPDQGGPAHRTLITNEPSSEPGDAVGDHKGDGPVTGQTPPPFPKFAQKELRNLVPDLNDSTANEWTTAWNTAHATYRELEPILHLTKYLARCREAKRKPSVTEWLKWFVEDEQKERRASRGAVTSDETPPQWWEN